MAKNGHSFTDEDEPNPHDNYSRSKWQAEQALEKIGDLEKVVVRPSLIYGPTPPGNLQRLISLAKSKKPFPLGGVHNKRSLLSVRNLSSFIVKCLDHPTAVGKTYVLADEEVKSTTELYEAICTNLKVPPKLVNIPEPLLRGLLALVGKRKMAERLCDTLVIDASRARSDLSWTQTQSQDEGLREMVQ
jgi:nucleoside-diphosphate-sugar epimerase